MRTSGGLGGGFGGRFSNCAGFGHIICRAGPHRVGRGMLPEIWNMGPEKRIAFVERVCATLREHDMIRAGERVLAAVSGGRSLIF